MSKTTTKACSTPALAPERRGSADVETLNLPATDLYFTKLEVARLLKISVRFVTRLMRSGALPYLRLGRAVRFRLEDVQRQLNARCLVCEGTSGQEVA